MKTMITLVASMLFALAVMAAGPANAAGPSAPQAQRAVLITGASSGIGRKIAERLAADGHLVYAGARKATDLEALGRIANVRPVRLDVTSAADIAAAVETVTKAGHGLHGLVNNAGIASVGSFADTTEEDFDFVMEVNVHGPWRVTKAFTPLLAASKGRVTNIGSLSGTVSPRDLGVYSMTKHAIEAYTDSLALQLEPLGVQVNIIEPGNYNTEIGSNAAARLGIETRMSDRSRFPEPDDVATAVVHALFAPDPKRRYLVVPNQREAEVIIRKAIEELVQLNGEQPYSYDRDALVRMLDEALRP